MERELPSCLSTQKPIKDVVSVGQLLSAGRITGTHPAVLSHCRILSGLDQSNPNTGSVGGKEWQEVELH